VRISLLSPHNASNDDRHASSIRIDDSVNSSKPARKPLVRNSIPANTAILTAIKTRKITPVLQQSGITTSIGALIGTVAEDIGK
jgi:hypothetical protein